MEKEIKDRKHRDIIFLTATLVIGIIYGVLRSYCYEKCFKILSVVASAFICFIISFVALYAVCKILEEIEHNNPKIWKHIRLYLSAGTIIIAIICSVILLKNVIYTHTVVILSFVLLSVLLTSFLLTVFLISVYSSIYNKIKK